MRRGGLSAAGDGLLTVTRYPVAWGEKRAGSGQFSSKGDAVVFIAKVAVAVSPILTFWAAGLIGWFRRRTLWRRSQVASQPVGHPRDKLAEARRSSRNPR